MHRPPRRRGRVPGLGAMNSSILAAAAGTLAGMPILCLFPPVCSSGRDVPHEIEIRHGHGCAPADGNDAEENKGKGAKYGVWFAAYGCSPSCGSTGPSHHCGHRSGCSGSCTLSPRRAAPRPAQNWGFTMPLHPFSELVAWTKRGQGTLRTCEHGRQGVGDGTGAVLAHEPA